MTNLPDQPSLPGMGELDSRLESYLGVVLDKSDKAAEDAARLAWLSPLQDSVWAEFCTEVLRPRELIWDETLDEIRRDVPDEICYGDYDNYTGSAMSGKWKFRLQKQLNSPDNPNGLPTVMDIETIVQAGVLWADIPDEMKLARNYLIGETRLSGVESQGYDGLLGVQPVGKRKNRTIPHDELNLAFVNSYRELVDKTDWLRVIVTANALGYDKPEQIFYAQIRKHLHDQTNRPYALETKPWSTETMFIRYHQKHGTNFPLVTSGMLECLREELQWDIGEPHNTFQAVIQVIRESAPIVPEKLVVK
jgi:hypothetical protein